MIKTDIPEQTYTEAFDPSYFRLNNLKLVLDYTDSLLMVQGYSPNDDIRFIRTLNQVLLDRFYHSYSYYTWKDNFLLYAWAACTEIKYRGIIQPEDILKYPYAACSQQAIVFQALVAQKNIPFRSVLLNGHYCSEVFIQNRWVFIDTNRELQINNVTFSDWKSAESIASSAYLQQAYYQKNTVSNIFLPTLFHNMKTDSYNTMPGARGRMLHQITIFLSDYFWLFGFWMFIIIGLSRFMYRRGLL